MSHETMSMSFVENPTKRFSKIITGVDNARDVSHDEVTFILPILNGKMLNVDMS